MSEKLANFLRTWNFSCEVFTFQIFNLSTTMHLRRISFHWNVFQSPSGDPGDTAPRGYSILNIYISCSVLTAIIFLLPPLPLPLRKPMLLPLVIILNMQIWKHNCITCICAYCVRVIYWTILFIVFFCLLSVSFDGIARKISSRLNALVVNVE